MVSNNPGEVTRTFPSTILEEVTARQAVAATDGALEEGIRLAAVRLLIDPELLILSNAKIAELAGIGQSALRSVFNTPDHALGSFALGALMVDFYQPRMQVLRESAIGLAEQKDRGETDTLGAVRSWSGIYANIANPWAIFEAEHTPNTNLNVEGIRDAQREHARIIRDSVQVLVYDEDLHLDDLFGINVYITAAVAEGTFLDSGVSSTGQVAESLEVKILDELTSPTRAN